VWDREYGFLRQVLAAPVPRSSVVAGKAAGGTCVAMIQGAVLLALAPTAGMTLTVPLAAGLLGICLVTALALALFGIALAGLVRRVESFQVLVQFLLFPLIFLSGALFPLQGLPGWLAAITKLNPLTYAIDPLRQLVFESQGVPAAARERFAGVQFGDWRMGLVLELAVLVGFGLLCLLVASRGLSRRERP
jgi:ABC-2 type transport system permease protein